MNYQKKLAAIFVANKLFLFIVAAVAVSVFPFGAIFYENMATYDSGWAFLNGWSLWDGNSYIQIARDGYFGRYFAYFPLWPYALKAGSYLTAGNFALAGLILNLGFSWGAVWMIYRLCKLEFKQEKTAVRTVFYLLFFPTAFFFVALYGESLFLFLAASAMYFLMEKKWIYVAVFTFFAAMTREVGGALILPVLYAAWMNKNDPKLQRLLAIAGPILGVCAVMLIYFLKSGDPLIFLSQHGEFGKSLSFPHVPIIDAIKNIWPIRLYSIYHGWNLFSLVFTVVLTYYSYTLLPKEYFLYLIAVLIPPLCSSNLEAYSRYLLVAFPLFMALAVLQKKKGTKVLTTGLYVVFTAMLAVFCLRFVMGGEGSYPF